MTLKHRRAAEAFGWFQRAGHVTAKSGGGNLNIGWAKVMTLQTAGGSIQVTKCDGKIKAETAGGNIELNDIAGAA